MDGTDQGKESCKFLSSLSFRMSRPSGSWWHHFGITGTTKFERI